MVVKVIEKILILTIILLFLPIAFAQNITITNSTTNSISLPFIGEITIMGGIVGLVLFFMGYMIGSGIKSGIKFAIILFLFVLALYLMGVISKEVIIRISDTIQALKPLVESFEKGFGMGGGALNFQILMFFGGLIVGLWRG
jgi:hypothetical protein